MNALQLLAVLLEVYKLVGSQIQEAKAAALQSGELTQEQHDAIVAYMNSEAERPEWLPSA